MELEGKVGELKGRVEEARESVEMAFDVYAELLAARKVQVLSELETVQYSHEANITRTFTDLGNISEKIGDACA